ncbi:MAG: hypothetical protein Aurels2KO_20110 [Aureliella sp.]
MKSQTNTPGKSDDDIWVYASLVAVATAISFLVSIPLFADTAFGPLALIFTAIAVLSGLLLGPLPLLFAAIVFIAVNEPPALLTKQPVLSVTIAAGICVAILCITRARSVCNHHELRFRHFRQLFSLTSAPPTDRLIQTFLAILIALVASIGIVLVTLWLIPLSNNSLRFAGLRPTAFRAIQIMFSFAGAYFVIRLFITQLAFRRMRPAQARVYLGSLLSGSLLPDARGMYKRQRKTKVAKSSTTKQLRSK